MKELVVFDLDGTLAESKAPIDDEMAKLLLDLLGRSFAGKILHNHSKNNMLKTHYFA
jgi:hydroxymethylpyrimidine pyrophosphatase-like HAD family hydrolase